MMQEEKKEIILDQPETQPKQKDYNWLAYSSLGILTAGVVFQQMHWPIWSLLMLIGMAGMTARSILLFIQKPRPLFAWFYFAGRILLFVTVGLYFSRIMMNPKLFYLPLTCFLIGLGIVMFSSKQNTDDSTDDI